MCGAVVGIHMVAKGKVDGLEKIKVHLNFFYYNNVYMSPLTSFGFILVVIQLRGLGNEGIMAYGSAFIYDLCFMYRAVASVLNSRRAWSHQNLLCKKVCIRFDDYNNATGPYIRSWVTLWIL